MNNLIKSHQFSRGILVFFLLSTLCFIPAIHGQNSWYKSTAFSDDEYLKYQVKWGPIRLGTIEIFQKQSLTSQASSYQIEMHARSENLPFIDVFFINKGILNPTHPTLQDFELTVGKEMTNKSHYTYNPEKRVVYLETRESDIIVRQDSVLIAEEIYDALGIFMMMRCLSSSGFKVTLQNIVDFNVKTTEINFSGNQKNVKVAGFEKSVSALQFSGKANWEGKAWAGVTGNFTGWISDDLAAIPLKVQIKIFLGSITLELEKYQRPDSLLADSNQVLNQN